MGAFNLQNGPFILYKQSSVSMQHAMKVYAGVVVQFHELSGK
jgi:hypothetical protein